MSEGFNVHFPAMVGDVMYLLDKGGEIREAVVLGYAVNGNNLRMTAVKLLVNGSVIYRSMWSVGRTIFPNRQSAEVEIAEGMVDG